MEFPTGINSTSLFPILGLLGGTFHLNLKANSGEPDERPHFAASDLVLHCLPMFPKKLARLIWANHRVQI